jgi:rhodanese-related sulfurtransferase
VGDNRRPAGLSPRSSDPSVTQSDLLAFAGAHPYLSLALAAITLALVYNEAMSRLRGFKGIGPAQLTALANRDNALVVDLRPLADFEKGHIPGARNVQMSQFDPENKQLAAARALPVVLVCKTGQSAAGAAGRLRKAGFEQVYVLDGGIGAWQQADLPLAKGR